MSCVSVAGATFISARSDRTEVTRSTTQPISASASAAERPAWLGHGASVSGPARGAGAVTLHNSSVRNGMKGCSSLRISSRAQATIARVSLLAAPSGPVSTGLASSRYQSQ